MRLFEVGNGKRVRLTSGTIRWAAMGQETETLLTQATWMGITTGSYWVYEGVERRLLIDHTLKVHKDSGIWQRDVECEVLETPRAAKA